MVSVIDSVKQEARNIIWLVLAASALFAGLCGIFVVNSLEAILEAISIVVVALVILIANSASDWHKDNSFVKLRSMVQDEKSTVMRGKINATANVNVWDLVVGDIVFLEAGQRVPADCIVIESADLVIDETPNDATDEVQLKTKAPFRSLNYEEHRGQPETGDPFLKADSMVSRGSCKVVVCCVGEHSSRGKYQADVSDELNQDTSL